MYVILKLSEHGEKVYAEVTWPAGAIGGEEILRSFRVAASLAAVSLCPQTIRVPLEGYEDADQKKAKDMAWLAEKEKEWSVERACVKLTQDALACNAGLPKGVYNTVIKPVFADTPSEMPLPGVVQEAN